MDDAGETGPGVTRALIVGASGGIGAALAGVLRGQGAEVTALSRRDDGLDVTDEASVIFALSGLTGPFDLVLVATGALAAPKGAPEKSLDALDPHALASQFAVNATGPALVLKHVRALLPRRERAVFAALSARVGSIGDNRLGGWYSYRASKAALNQLIHGAAIELRRTHPGTIAVCLHPGTVATPFTTGYDRADKLAPDEAARRLLAVISGLKVEQSGGFYDHAGSDVPW